MSGSPEGDLLLCLDSGASFQDGQVHSALLLFVLDAHTLLPSVLLLSDPEHNNVFFLPSNRALAVKKISNGEIFRHEFRSMGEIFLGYVLHKQCLCELLSDYIKHKQEHACVWGHAC